MDAEQVLREWEESVDAGLDPELQAVCNALFLEEAFGVRLSEAEIDPDVIGTAGGMMSVLVSQGRLEA